MSAVLKSEVRREALRIAGEKVLRDRVIEVRFPYTGEVVATVPKATVDDVAARSASRANTRPRSRATSATRS